MTEDRRRAEVSESRVLGRLEEFDPKSDNILKRLQLYFNVAIFLTVIGAKAYDTLRSLLGPTLLKEKGFMP